MNSLPPETEVGSLAAGQVLYFENAPQLLTDIPHYHVVLHAGPYKVYLLMAVASSKVEERKKRIKDDYSTYVTTGPEECSFLSCETIFDCNSAHAILSEKLEDKIRRSQVRDHGFVPEDLLDRIKRGVMDSEHISPWQKRLIDPDYYEDYEQF